MMYADVSRITGIVPCILHILVLQVSGLTELQRAIQFLYIKCQMRCLEVTGHLA